MDIKNPWYFFVPAATLVAYLLYTMIRKRKEERPDAPNREPEL